MSSPLPLYTVDSFSSRPFAGNPAAVCLLDSELPDDVLVKIAAEINLPETAFVQRYSEKEEFNASDHFKLRWFTPTTEVKMCGHGTLASAAVLFNCLNNKSPLITFSTLSGDLLVQRQDNGDIGMDMPLNPPQTAEISDFSDLIKSVVGDIEVKKVLYSVKPFRTLIICLDLPRYDFAKICPDQEKMLSSSSNVDGVIITCNDPSGTYDYLCRFFAPWLGIPEDPVCGAAQTMLGPYWSDIIGKKQLKAHQCSKRGGDITLNIQDNGRMIESGPARVVIKGQLYI